MKSAVAHAIKTNHFAKYTWLLSKLWKLACKGARGYHFDDVTDRDKAIMRGWSLNHEEEFNFTSTHDLCDCRFSKSGLEKMVRTWYQREQELRIEEDAEFERKHPEFASIPRAGKPIAECTLDEWIFDFCA
jgi:hypothetical protein